MPKVTVIIPTHNRPDTLRSAVSSVLNQTFQDFEVLVVDDASRVDAREGLAALGDDRIRCIRHSTNRGEAETRNTGVRNAKGEYVAFLDDDDEWLPTKLGRQVALLESRPTVGVCYTGYVTISLPLRTALSKTIPKRRGDVYAELLKRNFIGIPSCIVLRRTCLARAGEFDVNIGFGTDYDMWIRISKHFLFDFVADTLVNYHVHEGRMSASLSTRLAGNKALLAKHRRLFATDRRSFSRRHFEIGATHYLLGDHAAGSGYCLKAMVLDPLNLKQSFKFFCLGMLGSKIYDILIGTRSRLGTNAAKVSRKMRSLGF